MSFWHEADLYIAMVVFGLVLFAKQLIGEDPIDPKRLLGELILSCTGAAIFHALGMLQGLHGPEYWLMIFLASLGGVRSAEWMMKIFIALKKASL